MAVPRVKTFHNPFGSGSEGGRWRRTLNLGSGSICTKPAAMKYRDAGTLSELVERCGHVDRVGIEERVAKYGTRSIKKASKVFGLRMAVSMVDLTTLEGKDTRGKVRKPSTYKPVDLSQLVANS